MSNIKIKTIQVQRPQKPRYPQDDKNMICIVVFDNNTEWCPSFDEMLNLNNTLKETYNWNLNNDCWVKAVKKT